MNKEKNEENRLPHRCYFQLCAGCGICNDYCTVNVKDSGSTAKTTPQEIAMHLIQLDDDLIKGGELNSKNSAENSIPPTYICTSCDLCHHNCPYYVPFFKHLIDARHWIREKNLESVPGKVLEMEEDIYSHGNPFGYPQENREEWIKEDFPVIEKADVVYYPGCQNAYQLFTIEKAILNVIKSAGLTVTTPGASDKCCGRPLYFSGKFEEIEYVAKQNVENVRSKSVKELVISCSSCYLAFKKDYPPIVGKLPFEVFHTTEYFNKLLKEERLRFTKSLDKKIIYHDPCELGRVGGILNPPRELLSSLPGVTLLDFEKHKRDGHCCGGGGLLEAVDEEQSYWIGEKLVQEAIIKGADILATACPTCNSVFNMSKNNMKRKGKLERKIRILDIAEIVQKYI